MLSKRRCEWRRTVIPFAEGIGDGDLGSKAAAKPCRHGCFRIGGADGLLADADAGCILHPANFFDVVVDRII
jgi:hypothetical protein